MSESNTNSAIAERLRELRQQIQRRLERTIPSVPVLHSPSSEPLESARAAARNLAAAIGTVNPRPPGLVNGLIQSTKRLMARSLDWLIRPQREFNRTVAEALAMVARTLGTAYQDLHALADALDQSRRLHQELCSDIDRFGEQMESRVVLLQEQLGQQIQLHTEQLKNQAASLQEQFGEQSKLQRWRLEGLVTRQSNTLQDQIAKLREQMETTLAPIQEELRVLRQRAAARSLAEAAGVSAAGLSVQKEGAAAQPLEMDYFQWERHFRGTEEEIRARQSFYLPFFQGRKKVLDLACGRGEFLELMRQANVPARGVDLDADMVGRCLQKGLDVVQDDVFQYLETIPKGSLDGIFCAQFVEHLEPASFIRLVSQSAAKLAAGGVLAVETQNPECLAIFSQTFFLDPTHVRPIPPAQMRLVFAEAGLERMTTHLLSPASAHLPVLPSLDSRVIEAETVKSYNAAVARFNETFFGGMDYAVIGYRPNSTS